MAEANGKLLGDFLFGKSQLTPDPQLREFFNRDYFNKPTTQAPMEQTPSPAPTPAPQPTPGPERQAPYRPTGFNAANAPHLALMGTTYGAQGVAEDFHNAMGEAFESYNTLKGIHEKVGVGLLRTIKEMKLPPEAALAVMQRHAAATPSVFSVVGPRFLNFWKQSLMKSMGAISGGPAQMLFNVVGDPFNHIIRELGPPPGVSPLAGERRTYWNEKAL